MRLPAVAALLLAATAVSAKRVVELDPDNFDVLTGDGRSWMIEVYAPWCGHCRKLEPLYEAAAERLAGKVAFGRIDGSKYRSLSTRFGVNGFPTMFHLDGATGDVRRAAVQHTADSIAHFATKGWQAAAFEPIPLWQSPNGPLKKAVFFGFKYGERVVALHEPIAEYLGVPPVLVQFMFALIALVVSAAMLVVCAVASGPGGLRGRPREHAD